MQFLGLSVLAFGLTVQSLRLLIVLLSLALRVANWLIIGVWLRWNRVYLAVVSPVDVMNRHRTLVMNDFRSMLNVDRRLGIVMIMPVLAVAYRRRYSMANDSTLIVKNLRLLVHNFRLVVFGVRWHRVGLGVVVPCLEMPPVFVRSDHIRPSSIMIT